MSNPGMRLNQRSLALCDSARASLDDFDVRTIQYDSTQLLDFGTDRCGQLNSGLLLARICMADFARVALNSQNGWPFVEVQTDHPLLACIAAQYAGWPVARDGFFAMGSGPARMSRGQEELLTDYDLVHSSPSVVVVLETNRLPDQSTAESIVRECQAEHGTICIARTASLPGSIQIVARSVETTLHKLHEIGVDLRKVTNAMGSAPLPPVPPDDLTALGWTNDAILYGAEVFLWIDEADDEIRQFGPRVPSCSSSEFGRPFLEIFKHYNQDFYQIDPMLFSPAEVTVQSTQTGNTFRFGAPNCDLLNQSFGFRVRSV